MKINRGDIAGAAEAFMAWTKGGGRELPGLVKRRKAERALCLS
jgi:lysozyme